MMKNNFSSTKMKLRYRAILISKAKLKNVPIHLLQNCLAIPKMTMVCLSLRSGFSYECSNFTN